MTGKIKSKTTILLIATLIITSLPGYGRITYADTRDILVADEEIRMPSDVDLNDSEFVEGDVIVCVKSSDDRSGAEKKTGLLKSVQKSLRSVFSFDPAATLLDQAEDLMDVTEGVEEVIKEGGLEELTGKEADDEEGGFLSSIPLLGSLFSASAENESAKAESAAVPDDGYTLKFIHSDSYTTQQMIDMLKDKNNVLFAEPNYICHLADTDFDDENDMDILSDDIELTENILVDPTDNTLFEETGDAVDDTLPEGSYVSEDDILHEVPAEDEGGDILTEDNDTGADMGTDNGNDDQTTGTIPDLTNLQYAYGNGPGGIDVPGWNNNDPNVPNTESIVVAVLDCGVDYNHEDLNMWDEGEDYPSLVSMGGGKYGYCSPEENTQGEPYDSKDPMDDNSHGTHCAGIIGAGWNGYGVSGAVNGVKIMAVKIFNEIGSADFADIFKGMNYVVTAKKAGVNVAAVNNSWTLPMAFHSIKLAVNELNAVGVINCFASGNEKTDTDIVYTSATIMRLIDGEITVGSSDSHGKGSNFSNYGIRTMDLYAPGDTILSTVPMGTGGPIAEKAKAVVDMDGIEEKDDFRGLNEYFTYSPGEGTYLDRNDRDEGRRVMYVSRDNTEISGWGSFTISGNRLMDEEKPPKFLVLSARSEENEGYVYVFVKTKDGDWVEILPTDILGVNYSNVCCYELPDNMDIDLPSILFYFNKPTYVRDIVLTNDVSDYKFLSGTSMATPAVTGEVAYLAAKWPNDSVGRRAARVLASVKKSDQLSDTCRTGGMANVRKALSCEYAPVVNRAWMDENGEVNVSGYFFGHGNGSISVNYRGDIYTGTVKEWVGQSRDDWAHDGLNGEDTVKFDLGLDKCPEDELLLSVTSSEGMTGSGMLVVDGADKYIEKKNFYDRLPLPEEGTEMYEYFADTYILESAALDGSIYFWGAVIGKYTDQIPTGYRTWRYDLPSEGKSGGWEMLERSMLVSDSANICAWDHKLFWIDDAGHIKWYSPGDNEQHDTGMVIPDIDNISWSSAYLTGTDDDLYLFLTTQKQDENGQFLDDKNELFRVDLEQSTIEKIYTLKTMKTKPALGVEKDAEGNTAIYAFVKKDETSIAYEKINLSDPGGISSETNEINLPDDFSFLYNVSNLRCAANKYGIVLTGPTDKTNGNDNLFFSFADNSLSVCKKQIVQWIPDIYVTVTEYNGKTYFLCSDQYSDQGRVFAWVDNEEFNIRKTIPVTGVSVYPETLELKKGNSYTLSATVTPSDADNKNVRWSSDKPGIASVDSTGKVTGLGAGDAQIIATTVDGNKTASCRVTVTEETQPDKEIEVRDERKNKTAVSPVCTVEGYDGECYLRIRDLNSPLPNIWVLISGDSKYRTSRKILCDISLVDAETGEIIELNDKVKCHIKFPLLSEMDAGDGDVKVVTIGSNGKLESVSAGKPYKENSVSYVDFDPAHFSEYGILYYEKPKDIDDLISTTTSGSSSSSGSSGSGSSGSSSSTSSVDILRSSADSRGSALGTSNAITDSSADGNRKLDNIPKTGDR